MTWLAADETALTAAEQEQQKAREVWREEIPDSIPNFKTAFAEARVIAKEFNDLGIEVADIDVSDIESLNKKIEDLTEELAKAKKDDKTDAGK